MRIVAILLVLCVFGAFALRKNSHKGRHNKNSESTEVDAYEDEGADLSLGDLDDDDDDSEEVVEPKKKKLKKPSVNRRKKRGIEVETTTIPTIDLLDLLDREKQDRLDKIKDIITENGGKVKPQYEDDDDDDDDDENVGPYEACNGDKHDNELCHCDLDELDCSRIVLNTDDPYLRTANLRIVKNFKPLIANFSTNEIRSIKKGEVIPKFEKYVSVLDFSHNDIRNIESGTFDAFKNLSRLILSTNNLRTIKKEWFASLGDRLHRLDLSYNKFHILQDGVFENLKNLKKLILDGNSFSKLRKEMFRGLDSLEEISLDDCDLENIPGDLFEYLPKLRGISLRQNPLDEIPRAISNVKGLKELDMSETNLAEIRENSFVDEIEIEELYLEKMKYLTVVRDCAFCGLSQLKILYLNDNNRLAELHPNAFGFISTEKGRKADKLEELKLHNGNLTTLNEFLLNFDNLTSFTAGGNPWYCDCSIAFLTDSATFTFKQDASFPKCDGPEKLKGRNLAVVHDYEVCPSLKSARKRDRVVTVLGLSLLVVFGIVGVYYGVTSGKFAKAIRRVQEVPEVSYSHLSERQEYDMNLESDFQPRPAEV